MTVQDFEHAMLAQSVWREAGDCNIDTMLCIAHTIVNLSRSKNISIGEAVVEHQRLHRIVVDPDTYPDVRDPKIARLIQKIDDVDAPYTEDLTNGALYYIDMAKPVPPDMAWIIKLPMVSLIGTKHFFKNNP